MLHYLFGLFKQLEFIEPDEARDVGIEVTSVEIKRENHRISPCFLPLEYSFPDSRYQIHVVVINYRVVGVMGQTIAVKHILISFR